LQLGSEQQDAAGSRAGARERNLIRRDEPGEHGERSRDEQGHGRGAGDTLPGAAAYDVAQIVNAFVVQRRPLAAQIVRQVVRVYFLRRVLVGQQQLQVEAAPVAFGLREREAIERAARRHRGRENGNNREQCEREQSGLDDDQCDRNAADAEGRAGNGEQPRRHLERSY
jgi:hypothetical protein